LAHVLGKRKGFMYWLHFLIDNESFC
jgi:hypothetical protein